MKNTCMPETIRPTNDKVLPVESFVFFDSLYPIQESTKPTGKNTNENINPRRALIFSSEG